MKPPLARLQPLWTTLRLVLDTVLPPRCLCCGCITEAVGSLCVRCWDRVRFLGPPACARCGLPFEIDPGPAAVCANCAIRPPRYGRARAVFRYDDASKPMVLAFKHADRIGSTRPFARWMARAGWSVNHKPCTCQP